MEQQNAMAQQVPKLFLAITFTQIETYLEIETLNRGIA